MRASLACVVLAPEPGPDNELRTPEETSPAVVNQIARRLKAAGRRSDAIGRLGLGTFAVVALETDAGQARQLASRLCTAIVGDGAKPAQSEFRMHAGCHGVTDFHAASIDAVELMFRATTALRQARIDPAGGWLREFEDTNAGPRPA
jgi:GGDEF domain-containing protein